MFPRPSSHAMKQFLRAQLKECKTDVGHAGTSGEKQRTGLNLCGQAAAKSGGGVARVASSCVTALSGPFPFLRRPSAGDFHHIGPRDADSVIKSATSAAGVGGNVKRANTRYLT